jgi:hypothetical protein
MPGEPAFVLVVEGADADDALDGRQMGRSFSTAPANSGPTNRRRAFESLIT